MAMINEYKLQSDKIAGEIVFTYNAGHLFSLVFKLKKALTQEQYFWLFQHLHYREADLVANNYSIGTVKLKRITPISSSDKVEMFCRLYKDYVRDAWNNPMDYIRGKKDHLMIRSFEISESLLRVYFTSDKVLFKGNYSIGNLCKFYNELCAEAAGANKKSKYPNHYDAAIVKRLSGAELSEYYKHLISKGLVVKKAVTGEILDFIPSNAAQQPSDQESK